MAYVTGLSLLILPVLFVCERLHWGVPHHECIHLSGQGKECVHKPLHQCLSILSYLYVNPVEGCFLVLGHHNNHKGTGLVFVDVPSVCSLLLIQFCEDTLQVSHKVSGHIIQFEVTL